jgi:hypothetical protein
MLSTTHATISKKSPTSKNNGCTPEQETVLRGLDEVNNLKYFGKHPTSKSEENIRKAMKALKSDQFYHKSHKEMCRKKLELGLNLVMRKEVSALEV